MCTKEHMPTHIVQQLCTDRKRLRKKRRKRTIEREGKKWYEKKMRYTKSNTQKKMEGERILDNSHEK